MADTFVAFQYGTLYSATVMSTALYGVTCMQTFFYYVHYQKESFGVQSLVAVLWYGLCCSNMGHYKTRDRTLNTVHEVLVVSGTYKYMMAALMAPTSSPKISLELVIEIIFTGLVSVHTQGFFVYRLYVFSKRRLFAPAIWLPLAVYQTVSFLLVSGEMFSVMDDTGLLDTNVLTVSFSTGIGVSWVFVAAGVDISIAIFFTYLLVRERTGTPILNSTTRILRRLTILAVNTGIWTAVFSILVAIMLVIFPSTFLHAVFGMPLCSLYCNTLLANLNARKYIQNEMTMYDMDRDLWNNHKLQVIQDTS